MTTQAPNHAHTHYQSMPGAERDARQRLSNILTALRLGAYEDAEDGLNRAAEYVADSEFSATTKYADLLQFHADTTDNESWQTIAERAITATALRRRQYVEAVVNPDIEPPQAIEAMHHLCCEDFNTRMDMVIACPAIYTESRLRR